MVGRLVVCASPNLTTSFSTKRTSEYDFKASDYVEHFLRYSMSMKAIRTWNFKELNLQVVILSLRDLCALSNRFHSVSHSLASRNSIFQCNKRIQELFKIGHIDQARQVFNEMIVKDAATWNSMISGYFQNDRVEDARAIFDMFVGKNVRTWTAMLTGYAKTGRIEDARGIFESMPERNVISWNAMVSGYIQNGYLNEARQLFDSMPEKNVSSWNSIIGGYCHCYQMSEARVLFQKMPERNLVSWMVIMSGFVQINAYREAWVFFVKMHRSEVILEQSIFVVALLTITGLNDLRLIGNLRTLAIKTGYEEDVVVGTTIVNAYAKNGCLDSARNFFEMMPEWNEYTWTAMISAFSQCGKLDDAVALYKSVPEQTVAIHTAMMTAYAQNGRIYEARCIFDMIPNPNIVTWNAMVAGYAQNELLEEARNLFRMMPKRNSASWAAMISGLVQNGLGREALEVLVQLHKSGTIPNDSSFTSALFACASIGAIEAGRQIHCLAIKNGCQHNSFVGNGLITMYINCKNMQDVFQVFDTMRVRDTVSWNSLITGFSKNQMLDDAYSTFIRMPGRDVVSWNSLISAFVQSGQGEIALQLFLYMQSFGVKPNELTVTSLSSACANLGASKIGKQIHTLVYKLGFNYFVFVNNALISMYMKCGCEDGFLVMEEMAERDVVTWNAILTGCTQNGLGREIVKFFEKMRSDGVYPDQISFLGLLTACSHAGLVAEGWAYFNSMEQDYGIKPLVHHYTCMVDLLGRAGCLSEAESLIKNMPMEPDTMVWQALLEACRINENIDLGQKVAENLFRMGTQNLLSNIYACQGMYDGAESMQKLMSDRGVTKEPGISWNQQYLYS